MGEPFPYYDIDGNLLSIDISTEDGLKKMTEIWGVDYRRVAQDYVGDVYISTVFLPIDHSFGSGPPIIFETMVFGYGDDDEYQWRYATKEEALAAHALIVDAVKAGTLTCNFDPSTT